MRRRSTDVNSTNRILPGMSRVSTRDRYDPRSVARTQQDGRRGEVAGRAIREFGTELGRVMPDVRMRPLPAAGAWQGFCDPIEKRDSGTARHFGPSLHPLPGAYKRRMAEPLALFFASRLRHLLLCSSRLCVGCSSLPLHSRLVCD